MKRSIVVILVVLFPALFTLAQGQSSCPSRSGIYAFADNDWIELQTAQAKKAKLRAAFPAHDRVIAVYPGPTSSTAVSTNLTICASGIPVGVTFALARAKQGSKDRQVTIGTSHPFLSSFNFEIDKKQAVELKQNRDKDGTYLLHASHLAERQYILFMEQGSSVTSTPVAFDFFVR
jgi:hypothetical protein